MNKPTQEFESAMRILQATFDRELTREAVFGYWIALGSLGKDALEQATRLALERCTRMPAPAELLAFAGQSPVLRAAQAWETVRGAIRRHGTYHAVDFGPLINAVVRNLGGWVWLSGRTTAELVWVRKDFEALFQQMDGRPISKERGKPLPGEHAGAPVQIGPGTEIVRKP